MRDGLGEAPEHRERARRVGVRGVVLVGDEPHAPPVVVCGEVVGHALGHGVEVAIDAVLVVEVEASLGDGGEHGLERAHEDVELIGRGVGLEGRASGARRRAERAPVHEEPRQRALVRGVDRAVHERLAHPFARLGDGEVGRGVPQRHEAGHGALRGVPELAYQAVPRVRAPGLLHDAEVADAPRTAGERERLVAGRVVELREAMARGGAQLLVLEGEEGLDRLEPARGVEREAQRRVLGEPLVHHLGGARDRVQTLEGVLREVERHHHVVRPVLATVDNDAPDALRRGKPPPREQQGNPEGVGPRPCGLAASPDEGEASRPRDHDVDAEDPSRQVDLEVELDAKRRGEVLDGVGEAQATGPLAVLLGTVDKVGDQRAVAGGGGQVDNVREGLRQPPDGGRLLGPASPHEVVVDVEDRLEGGQPVVGVLGEGLVRAEREPPATVPPELGGAHGRGALPLEQARAPQQRGEHAVACGISVQHEVVQGEQRVVGVREHAVEVRPAARAGLRPRPLRRRGGFRGRRVPGGLARAHPRPALKVLLGAPPAALHALIDQEREHGGGRRAQATGDLGVVGALVCQQQAGDHDEDGNKHDGERPREGLAVPGVVESHVPPLVAVHSTRRRRGRSSRLLFLSRRSGRCLRRLSAE